MNLIDNYIAKLIQRSTPNAPYWNIESIRQGKKPHWNYIDGCMMTSLMELHKETHKDEYLDFVKEFVDYYVFEDGTIRGYDIEKYSTDDICESRILFDLFDLTQNEKYLRAIEYTYTHVKKQPRTEEGNFWHKLIYPNQVWLDGLYMAQPFYTRYNTFHKLYDNYSDTINQFKNVRKLMFNEEKQLYYHGYDATKSIFWANKETGLSKNFWLRAMGWYAVALVDVFDYMSDTCDQKHTLFPSLLKEMIDGLLTYQDSATKLFYQVVDQGERDGNYLEASGSALLAFSILKGVRLGMLDERYRDVGLGIFDGISTTYLSEVDNDLNLKGICLVAGLGPDDNLRRDGSYEYYISEPIVENDAKGVGPFIMAYSEVIKFRK